MVNERELAGVTTRQQLRELEQQEGEDTGRGMRKETEDREEERLVTRLGTCFGAGHAGPQRHLTPGSAASNATKFALRTTWASGGRAAESAYLTYTGMRWDADQTCVVAIRQAP